MSDSTRPHHYAEECLQLAQTVTSPELRALLIRMAEVWEALSVHCDRIARVRAEAEHMLDEARSQHVSEPAAVDSPELTPVSGEPIDQQDFVSREHAE
jgi:hypothetical protein